MERRIAPSVLLEEQIADVLLEGIDDNGRLSEVGRLGARLVLQRAVDDEVEAFLARARYERTPEARGSRNGHRARRIQTAEGEISIAMPQVRGTVERFVTSVIPDTRTIVRTRPLERSLEEVQRRVKVIGRFPGETSCLSLCWAVLDLFISGARGLGLTDLDRQQLDKLRVERLPPPRSLQESA